MTIWILTCVDDQYSPIKTLGVFLHSERAKNYANNRNGHKIKWSGCSTYIYSLGLTASYEIKSYTVDTDSK